jgi:hypothetical protein
MIKEYEFHPLAELVPEMTVKEFEYLTSDIEENEQRDAITLYEGKILDGRHRYKACKKLGKKRLLTEVFKGNRAQAIALVWSRNNRRNLTAEQRDKMIDDLLIEMPQASNRKIAGMVKRDPKTVANRRAKAEEVGKIPTSKHPKARKTPNPKGSKPKAANVVTLVPTASSPEIGIEERKAQHAVLDAPREDRALNDFKYACNTYVPRMSGGQVKEAIAYLQQCVEDKAKASQPQNGAAVGSA